MSNAILLPPGAFRLALAGLVLISHLSNFEVGRLGVILFFLLSGYWISDLWQRQGRFGTSLFFLNRFLRIWPLYIVAVAFAAIALDRHVGLSNVTIFGVATAQGEKPLGVEWSLDIEAQFYILLPLIAVLRLPLWFAIPATIFGWVFAHYTGVQNVFMYLPAFVAGIWLYDRRSQPIPIGSGVSLVAFVALTLALIIIPSTRPQLLNTTPNFLDHDIFAMLWGMPLILYIGHSLRRKSDPFDRHLGNLSFPVYLLHEPIIRLLYPNTLLEKFIILIVVMVASIGVYIAIDMPIERFRYGLLKRLTSRRARSESLADQHNARSNE